MIDNPNDDPLEKLIDELRTLLRANWLRHASVDRGQLLMMAGSLLRVEGLLDVIGSLTGSGGTFDWDGPGFIRDNFEITSGGQLKVGGVVITPLSGGRIQIGPNIVLDSQTQTITVGTKIVISAADGGKIRVIGPDGDTVLTDGEMRFPNDGRVASFGADGSGLSSSSADILVGTLLAMMRVDGGNGVTVTAESTRITGPIEAPNLTPLPSGHGYRMVVCSEEDDQLYSYAGGQGGGPGDGVFAWPYELDLVTSEFGMRQHPVTGEWSLHEGIDFGLGIANVEGTPIPAAGSGTIEIAGPYGGYGNAVVINHGIDPVYDGGGHLIQTLYGHMYQAPSVSVGQSVALGEALGGIGSTGTSTDDHLHFEVWVDGVKVNPRTFMAQHGG